MKDLKPDEHEFLHQMYQENFNFDEWADTMDEAIQNGEIETEPPKAKEPIEFELEDLF